MPRKNKVDYSKLCIIIPAYNEAGSLARVYKAIKKQVPKARVVVINDGSSDNTGEVAAKLGVVCVNLPSNLGIGGSVQTGLKYAYRNGFEYAMQVDGDGQHDPKFIRKLFETAVNGKVDLTIGSRYIRKSKYETGLVRKLGINIFSQTIFWATDKRIRDCTSGFRVFGPKVIPVLVEDYPLDFPEPESIVKLLRLGYKIKEVPVEMKRRQAGVSSIDHIKAIYLMLSIPLSILVDMLRPEVNHESK